MLVLTREKLGGSALARENAVVKNGEDYAGERMNGINSAAGISNILFGLFLLHS